MKKLIIGLTLLASMSAFAVSSDSTDSQAIKCSAGYDLSGSFFNRTLRKQANKAIRSALIKRGFSLKDEGTVDVLFEVDLCGRGMYSNCDLIVRNMLGGGSYQSDVRDRRDRSNQEIINELEASVEMFDPQCD